jgi:ATP-dependent RNA helicase DDX3X
MRFQLLFNSIAFQQLSLAMTLLLVLRQVSASPSPCRRNTSYFLIGSGKTAAFLIPILSKLMGKAKKLAAPRPNPATYQEGITPPVRAEPLVLIVCPSRELATQIFDEARRFCYRTMLRPCVVYGGGPVGEQIRQLQKGCDLLIGSPGRLVDIINRPHVLTLKRLKYMVIDEADEMLNSDWETELKQIMSGGGKLSVPTRLISH